ncbi:ribosome-binding factor A [Dissulfurispira thermophila]|uniref:Ribosome-binding factor A n=2 Tax=root TaxID=1 RepID=A0A7G1GZ87_9BACT|nr:30S ribosome-binding factor RbfA [Dissulfurispira thermophila]BCB95558.1 ribosome-binding factor A [Dissulfurispira thermophila]
MHPYKRSQRLSILIREEIADIIMRRIKDPRLGFVTVTDVEMSEDLKIARIFISVMKQEDKDTTLEILNAAKGLIRNEVSKRVRTKFIPNIEFRIDKSIEHGDRIDKLLREIKEQM